MFYKCLLLGLCLTVTVAFAQQTERINLGRLQNGATVSFIRSAEGLWGIEIAGATAPNILQQKPAKLEVFRTENDISQLAVGYKTVEKSAVGIEALAEITYDDNVVFAFKVIGRAMLENTVLMVVNSIVEYLYIVRVAFAINTVIL